MGTRKTGESNLIRQGSILAVASIFVRIIGLVYRIPLANIIGDEGNGIYSVAFEVYSIILILTSFGMPMAVSKLVSAKYVNREYKNAYQIFRCSMIFSFLVGAISALIVYFGAEFIEKTFFYKYAGVAIPLKVLAPTIFIVSIMGVFRGFFQGKDTMMPTAVSQVIEQLINAIVSVTAAYSLMRAHSASGLISAWGAAGGTLGTCLGALAGLLFLIMLYMMYRPILRRQMRRDRFSVKIPEQETYRMIFLTIVPIIMSQAVFQASSVIDLSMFSALMGAKGLSDTLVSSVQGVFSTDYKTLVSVPISVSSSFAASIIPNIVLSFVNRDYTETKAKIDSAIKFNMIVAFPSAVGLTALAKPILSLLFPNTNYELGSKLLMLGAICIIFYAHSTVTSSALQSIDRLRVPVINSFFALIIHIIVVFVCLRYTNMGIYALVIGNVVFPVVATILNYISLRKYLGYRHEVVRTLCVPFISSVLMGVCALGVYELLYLIIKRNFITLPIAIAAAVVIYFVLVLKLKGLSKTELSEFPMGRTLLKIALRYKLL